MPFTGNENHKITLAEAKTLTANYRGAASSGAQLGGYFGKTALIAILSQDECVGMRIYYAKKDDGEQTFVLVGVNAAGNDLTGGEIAEIAWPCPPFCSDTKELIS